LLVPRRRGTCDLFNVLASPTPAPVAEIVTLDGRLAEAARLEGLSVLPAAD